MNEELINLIGAASNSYHVACILCILAIICFGISTLILVIVDLIYKMKDKENLKLARIKEEIVEGDSMYEIYQFELNEEDFKKFEAELNDKKEFFETKKRSILQRNHLFLV